MSPQRSTNLNPNFFTPRHGAVTATKGRFGVLGDFLYFFPHRARDAVTATRCPNSNRSHFIVFPHRARGRGNCYCAFLTRSYSMVCPPLCERLGLKQHCHQLFQRTLLCVSLTPHTGYNARAGPRKLTPRAPSRYQIPANSHTGSHDSRLQYGGRTLPMPG